MVAARTSHDPALLKPSPHLIQQAMTGLGMPQNECVLVGDSDTDMHAASAASPTSSSDSEPARCRIESFIDQDRRLRRRWPGVSAGLCRWAARPSHAGRTLISAAHSAHRRASVVFLDAALSRSRPPR